MCQRRLQRRAARRALPWTNGLTPQTSSIITCDESRLDIADRCLPRLAQSSVDWNGQKSEILTHYRDLIRIDTLAGKETKAVEYLRKVLEGDGIPTSTFALDSARAER